MSESTLLKNVISTLRAMRAEGHPIKWLKIHGNQYQEAGTPDLHITYRGYSFWIELKTDAGRVSAIQRQRLKEWGDAGACARVCRSVDEVVDLLWMIS